MKKPAVLFFGLMLNVAVYGQSQATLDSVMVEYKQCLETTKNRVTCTKELFWYYQDAQFDFYRKEAEGLDSIAYHQKAVECRMWVDTKNLFVGNEFRKFKQKYPKERMDNPTSKAAENDAYLAFKRICDFVMIRLNYLVEKIEAKEKK